MNILVVLRTVRDPAGFTVNRKAQKVFVNRASFIVNPSDRNALEAALALAGDTGAVTALAIGGEPAQDALRLARATGAGRAVCVAAPEAAPQAAPLDALGVTRVFERVVARLGNVDLVLLGAQVIDSDMAQVGPRLAAALDWPFIDRAYQARTLPDGGLGLVVAATDGAFRLLGVDMPAVATVMLDSNQPRFAPAAQIITIYQDSTAVESLTLADLGLDAAELSPAAIVSGESFPPERTLGRTLDGDDAVRQLADALRMHRKSA